MKFFLRYVSKKKCNQWTVMESEPNDVLSAGYVIHLLWQNSKKQGLGLK